MLTLFTIIWSPWTTSTSMLSLTNSEPIIDKHSYEVGMAESPSIAMVLSAMLRCDLVSTLFDDLK